MLVRRKPAAPKYTIARYGFEAEAWFGVVGIGQERWSRSVRVGKPAQAQMVGRERKHPNRSNATTWRLAAMNMAIRGIDFGKEPADTFTRDQHPDLRADFVMALLSAAARSFPRSRPADRPKGRINLRFNIKEWWDGNARWSRSAAKSASHAQFYQNQGKYGTPPQTAMCECALLKSEGTPHVVSEARDKNANLAWVQHMLQNLSRQSATTPDLAPNGSMALLLANNMN